MNGQRVSVWSQEGMTFLGEGVITGYAAVWYYEGSDGKRKLTRTHVEGQEGTNPPREERLAAEEAGMKLVRAKSTPVIQLDAAVLGGPAEAYGCMVWWKIKGAQGGPRSD